MRGIKFSIFILLLSLPFGQLDAQTSFRALLQKRSEPSADMWKALNQALGYSDAERRMLDDRSALDGRELSRLARRSELAGDDVRRLTARSEFSPSELRLLESRSEPDAAQTARIQRYSTPDAKLTQRNWLIDPNLLAIVLRQSNMSPEDQRHLFRDVVMTSVLNKIRRSALGDGNPQIWKRSVSSPDQLRRLRARSTD